jgi:hypothetical protein
VMDRLSGLDFWCVELFLSFCHCILLFLFRLN